MSGGWGILAGQGMRQYARRTAGNIEDLQDYVHNLAKNSLQMDSSGNVDISGVINIATAGGIFQGTGTFASPTTGLKIWNDAGIGRIAGYNAGVIQTYFGTDGKLYAGAGNVTLDATGIAVASGSAFTSTGSYRFSDGTNILGYVRARYVDVAGTVTDFLNVTLPSVTDRHATLTIDANTSATSKTATVHVEADNGTISPYIEIRAEGATTADGTLTVAVDNVSLTTSTTIKWGDVTLYRSAANILKTDDSMVVAVGLNVGSATGATAGQIKTSAAIYAGGDIYPNNQTTRYITDDGTYIASSAALKSNGVFLSTGLMTGNSGLEVDYTTTAADTWGIRLYQGDGATARTTYAYLDMNGTDRLRVVGNISGGGETAWAYINSNAGWNAASSRAVKFDIRQLENKDYDDLLASLREMNVYEYRRKDTPEALEVGVIAEEAPELMLAAGSNKAVNHTRSIGFLLGIVKAHDQELRAIKQRLAI